VNKYPDNDHYLRGPGRIVDRFLAKVDGPLFGCWEWTGYRDRGGYSVFWDRKTVVGHKWAWEHVNGLTPAGNELDHLCRNRGCVNPLHLEPVTRSENILRGDGPRVTAERNRKSRVLAGDSGRAS
jgi:hypothetical protein